MIQRVALYLTLGILLDALGIEGATAGFWCTVALFWASEHMTRRVLIEQLNEELQEMRRKDKDQ